MKRGTDIYSCPNKQKAREAIWREFYRHKQSSLAKALMLPGSKPIEYQVALSKGFKPENIYLVEKNLAVLANFTRRARETSPPRQNIFRTMLSEASRILADRNVRLDFAHLDFCANCDSNEMLSETKLFFKSGVMKDDGLVAISWMLGREQEIDQLAHNGNGLNLYTPQADSPLLKHLASIRPTDRGRYAKVYEAIGTRVDILAMGSYFNTASGSNMMFGIFQVTPTPVPRSELELLRSGTRQWKLQGQY